MNDTQIRTGGRRSRLWRGFALLAAVAAATTNAGVASAVQDDGNSSCVVLDYCAYTGSSFTGSVWTWYGEDNDWPSVIDEDESSVWNRSSTYTVRVYDFTGFGTYMYCTPPNSFYGTMGHPNDGNSHTWNSGC